MVVLNILIGFAFCLCISLLWRRQKYYQFMLKVPGPMGLPLIGVLHKFKSLEGVFDWGLELVQKHKSPALTWIGPFPHLVLWDPQTAQDILTSPNCVNRSQMYGPMRDVFGNGLITSANPEWKVHRKLLNPSFSNENLRSFVPIFNANTQTLIKDLDLSYGGEFINILPMMQSLTMYTALQTTMGLKRDSNIHSNEGKEEKLFKLYYYLAEKASAMVIMPWCRFYFIRKFVPSFKAYTARKLELQQFFQNKIHEKLKLLSTTDATNLELKHLSTSDDGLEKRKVQTFFDLTVDLMRTGQFTAKNVEDHTNNIVFGAFDTTATTITNALILLAMNPQYQEIAFEEILTLYADRDNVTVTEDDLQRLVYLEMVIHETMRLIPTIPVIGRTATSDIRLSSGIVVPAGTQIVIDIFNMHRQKSIWGPNALVFNPENFLPDNKRDKHSYAFIPFTKGNRSCIGRRYALNATKIVLAIILRKYCFTTTSKFEELRYAPAITTRIIDPPLLKMHLREK